MRSCAPVLAVLSGFGGHIGLHHLSGTGKVTCAFQIDWQGYHTWEQLHMFSLRE
jgi:hypothetical protein